MIVIDTIKSPPVDAMRAAGVTGVSRYLSWADSRDTLGKVIHAPEYNLLRANDFDVLLNWEYSAIDWLGGAAAGAAHAAEAVRQARALGYPAGCAIPGSADFNMTWNQWQYQGGVGYAIAYARGIRAGGYVAGVYGPWDVLGWCRDLGEFGMYWQAGMSTAWSAGRNAQLWPGAHLRQRGSMPIGGQDCDYNDIIQANYGGTMTAPIPGAYDDYLPDTAMAILVGQTPRFGYVTATGPKWDDDAVNNHNLQAVEARLTAAIEAVQPATVTMTDADRQAIIAGVSAELGGKLDQLLARLAAAGAALDG